MSPRVRDGSGTSHLMSALCRSEERRERERGMEETEMSVVLVDPPHKLLAWIFPSAGSAPHWAAGPPHEPFDEGLQRGIFLCGVNLGPPQNELIASTSLWTTDSPPGAMTLLPRGARRLLSCRSWFLPKPRCCPISCPPKPSETAKSNSL